MDTNELKGKLSAFRDALKGLAGEAVALRDGDWTPDVLNSGEAVDNITLGFRHLEDAAMRFGKAIQAISGGVSTLGGPNTPGATTPSAPSAPASDGTAAGQS